MGTALLISLFSLLIATVGVCVAIYSARNNTRALSVTLQKHDHETRKALKDEMEDACRKYTGSLEYETRKDKRIVDLANREIDAAFERRAPSFVDAKVFTEFREGLDKRLDGINETVAANTRAIGEQTGRISADIALQVNNFLQNRLAAVVVSAVEEVGEQTATRRKKNGGNDGTV